MSRGYAAPIFITAGLSYMNQFYGNGKWNGNLLDVKPLVAGGIAFVLASLISEVPGAEPIVTGIAWVALAAAIVVPVAQGKPSIITPLLNVANGKK